MATYITAFIFYTLAMVGILLVGFVVYKKIIATAKGENRGMIHILDSLAIAPKKMLLVVQIKDEKFLIASGAEHTTFLSKLADSETEAKISSKAVEDIQRKVLNNEEIHYQQPQELEKTYQEVQQYQQFQQYQPIQQAPEIQQIVRVQRPHRQEVRFDDVNGIRTQRIQQQFNELYGQEEPRRVQPKQTEDKSSQRREIIKKLLKDMNNSNTKTGSRV